MDMAQLSAVMVPMGLTLALASLYLGYQVAHLMRAVRAFHTFLATVWIEYQLRYQEPDNQG